MANRETNAFGSLPTVKCSSCGDEIDILALADHICGPQPQLTPPNSGGQAAQYAQDMNQGMGGFSGFAKPGRRSPPRIDPYLANRPFLHPNELTPANSNHGSRSASPRTAYIDPQRAYKATGRSMTTPLPRSPPSPEITNLDNPFPPFPTTAPRLGTPVNDSRGLMSVFDDKYPKSNGFGSRSSSMSGARGRSMSGNNGRNRGNTFMTSPEINKGRQSIASNFSSAMEDTNTPAMPALPNWTSQNKGTSNGQGGRAGGAGGFDADPSPYAQMNPYAMQSNALVASPEQEKPPPVLWPGTRKVGGSGIPSPTRSQTFPIRDQSNGPNDGPNRRPSEPTSQAKKRAMAAMNGMSANEPMGEVFNPVRAPAIAPQSPTHFPPRKDSRPPQAPEPAPAPAQGGAFFNIASKVGTMGSVLRGLTGAAPSNSDDAANPSHTPSDSASSNGSDVSATATDSSKSSISSSPPRENKAIHAKKPSLDMLPLRLFSRQPSEPKPEPEPVQKPVTPVSPVFQKDLLSPNPRNGRTLAPYQSQRQASPESIRRPPTRNGTTKGPCRGCSKLIMAGEKSVSSADGRLTGRYHKACFVCHTCQEPFPTADFYVIDNAPYCGKHYHEANGSVCATCGEGIEGQYLEADVDETPSQGPKKFHPDCFTCGTCRLMLSDDFYIFGGNVYCERDGFKAAEKQANGHSRTSSKSSVRSTGSRSNRMLAPGMGPATGARRFPQKRTTRMLMI